MPRLFLVLCVICFVSCQKPSPVSPAPANDRTDTVFTDIGYGSHSQQKMDLYLPAGRTDSSPVLILIHGGGWKEGSKNELSFFAKKFQKKGFAVANINYRLAVDEGDHFKMQLDDIGSVISYLQQHAIEHHYSDNRFYITGHSAGGHLSLSYGYTRNQSGIIKGVAGMAAPTNLFSMAYYNPVVYGDLLTNYLGAPLSAATNELYKSASPYYQATTTSVPTILFQGELDIIVNKDQATGLAGKLKQLQVPEKVVLYPFVFHDWWTNNDLINNTVEETTKWFDKYR